MLVELVRPALVWDVEHGHAPPLLQRLCLKCRHDLATRWGRPRPTPTVGAPRAGSGRRRPLAADRVSMCMHACVAERHTSTWRQVFTTRVYNTTTPTTDRDASAAACVERLVGIAAKLSNDRVEEPGDDSGECGCVPCARADLPCSCLLAALSGRSAAAEDLGIERLRRRCPPPQAPSHSPTHICTASHGDIMQPDAGSQARNPAAFAPITYVSMLCPSILLVCPSNLDPSVPSFCSGVSL